VLAASSITDGSIRATACWGYIQPAGKSATGSEGFRRCSHRYRGCRLESRQRKPAGPPAQDGRRSCCRAVFVMRVVLLSGEWGKTRSNAEHTAGVHLFPIQNPACRTPLDVALDSTPSSTPVVNCTPPKPPAASEGHRVCDQLLTSRMRPRGRLGRAIIP